MGKNKSGREWKVVQTKRASAQTRMGIMEKMSTTYEEKQKIKEKKDRVKAIEQQMKADRIAKQEEEKRIKEERQQRRIANEQKSTSYQMINTGKLKGMSKKQLRMIRKTSVNEFGQVELVSPWGNTKNTKKKK
eukprot:CAMPEP_0182427744 /NCGR_PEP_ID=MMETSP1167-20130531/19156_1 /TAXON_ID=2988 /ORGANISM="Mallomonas Sp, Strain CCMP3275" /LENGTH=132 /DNA_ID=CAMNT_0024610193 /DNA_START=253 /DNA_END=651 /DNA_ORIENTATION=+